MFETETIQRKTVRRRLRAGFALFAAIFLMLVATHSAVAARVDPTQRDGSGSCKDFTQRWLVLKVDPVRNGTYSDGTLSVTITIVRTHNGPTFDWTSNIGVDAAFVAGGPNGNLYQYDPPAEATSDTGLHAPVDPTDGRGNRYFNMDNATFCYDVREPDSGPDGRPDGSVDGTTDGRPDGTVDGTTDGTTDSTVDGTTDGTTDSTVDGTTDGTTDGTVDGTTDGTTDGTVDGTTDGTGDGTVDGNSDDGQIDDGQSDDGTVNDDGDDDDSDDDQGDGNTDGTVVDGGSTDGGSTDGSTVTPPTGGGTVVLSNTIKKQPLATTGSETTTLAWLGSALLLAGCVMRFVKLPAFEARSVASSATQDLLSQALRRSDRNWTCRG